MTEIKTEKKKQVWLWLPAVITIAALLIYFLMFRDNDEHITEVVTVENYISDTHKTNLLNVKENNDTVAAYVNFIKNSEGKMSLDHAYSNEALLKLIEATNAIAVSAPPTPSYPVSFLSIN